MHCRTVNDGVRLTIGRAILIVRVGRINQIDHRIVGEK